jgi:DNA adenine methylase
LSHKSLNQPILRWVGGKWKLVKIIKRYFPLDLQQRFYCEPFVGAGSIFFEIQPKYGIIADANYHLIECYSFIKLNPELISDYLNVHSQKNSKEYYYMTRDKYNQSKSSAAQAARFIYLNRTCFNGIFRVNKDGLFNVPYGQKEKPTIPRLSELKRASQILAPVAIKHLSYEQALDQIPTFSFVYFDPPYPPLNGTSNFTHYTKDGFSESDQIRLSVIAKNLDTSGIKFLMSNADIPIIRKLYSNFNIKDLPVIRYVTSKSTKHKVSELIITNYDTD